MTVKEFLTFLQENIGPQTGVYENAEVRIGNFYDKASNKYLRKLRVVHDGSTIVADVVLPADLAVF